MTSPYDRIFHPSSFYKGFWYVVICLMMVPFDGLGQEAGPAETNLTNHPSSDRYASFSPKGHKIVFESDREGHWDIYVMDFSGENLERLTEHGSDDRRPSWHPNGENILFESNRSGSNQLYSLSLDDGQIQQLTEIVDGSPIFGAYSADGKQIMVSIAKSDTEGHIVLLDSNGHVIRSIVENKWRNFYPKWSNEGNDILYFSRKDTENEDDEIYSLDIETGMEVRLTHWPKHNFCPSWSPDDNKIAYVTSMEASRPEIYVMDSNGANAKRLTFNEDGDTLPNWSPDGTKLLITAYRNGNFEIVSLRVD